MSPAAGVAALRNRVAKSNVVCLSMTLTDKQKRFVEEYCIDFNATAAARRAGYSARSARTIGPENLSKPAISAAIREQVHKALELADIKPEDVWREWGHICRSYIGDIFDFSGLVPKLKPAGSIPESALRAIASMKVKRYMEGHGDSAVEVEVTEVRFWDKPSTLSTVAKAMGDLIDRVEHSGPGGGPIPHQHILNLPDFQTEEFRALPPEERLRRLREAIQKISRN